MIDLKRCRLYGILDLGYVEWEDADHVAGAMISGGVDILQLRAKKLDVATITEVAAKLHRLTSAAGVPLIINDYPEIARAIGAEGVHVGQDDLSIARVREMMGSDCVVGRSTHSLTQARQAAAGGADYIGFGPLFATPTKPDYLPIGLEEIAAVHAQVPLPIFCIGGIKLENLPTVLAAGARRVVIVSGLLHAPDIAKYARAAKALLHPQSEISNQK
ncbi:MAG: thiamine phosphate synthase [Verrucomicrobiota bacterium]|nr:thiamine phosphate synthase [Verrucomicrobiota bacterium]